MSTAEQEVRYRGRVADWRGTWGFIESPSFNADVFVHFSQIADECAIVGRNGNKFRRLIPGQSVSFETGLGPNGEPEAKNVKVMSR